MAQITAIILLACLAAVSAQTPAPVLPSGPCVKGGSYHLSCYTKSITAKAASDAKSECLKAWNNPLCKPTIVSTYANAYGCETAITYSFANDACRESYQGQEKTNPKCAAYVASGLGNPVNRLSAQVASDYPCLNPGPCGKTAGAYHVSCYAKTVTPAMALSAKTGCFKAWNKPTCKPTVQVQVGKKFGCDTLIAYSFATTACRDDYQAQEKTNTKCTDYIKYGLANDANRKTATVAKQYNCPVPKLF